MMRTATITASVALALTVAGCGSTPRPAAPPTPTVVVAPTPTYDGSTMQACHEAARATDTSDTKHDHAHAARGFAELSDVAALREVARKYSDAPAGTTLDDVRAFTAAIVVDTWCLQHHVKA